MFSLVSLISWATTPVWSRQLVLVILFLPLDHATIDLVTCWGHLAHEEGVNYQRSPTWLGIHYISAWWTQMGCWWKQINSWSQAPCITWITGGTLWNAQDDAFRYDSPWCLVFLNCFFVLLLYDVIMIILFVLMLLTLIARLFSTCKPALFSLFSSVSLISFLLTLWCLVGLGVTWSLFLRTCLSEGTLYVDLLKSCWFRILIHLIKS